MGEQGEMKRAIKSVGKGVGADSVALNAPLILHLLLFELLLQCGPLSPSLCLSASSLLLSPFSLSFSSSSRVFPLEHFAAWSQTMPHQFASP